MLNPEYTDWVKSENGHGQEMEIGFTDDVPDVVLKLRLTTADAIALKGMLQDAIRERKKKEGKRFLI